MSDSLHIDVQGKGRAIVLMHGWGFHGGIWDPLAERLAKHFCVIRPDLPGHGHSPLLDREYRLDSMVDEIVGQVAECATGPAIWVGWSLGSLFALKAAIRHPNWVQGVVSVAGTPCFTARDGWAHGVLPAVIDRFGDELTDDWKATLRRFLALQGQGCDPRLMRRVRNVVMDRLPSPEGLRGALRILRNEDLRKQLQTIACPVLAINGVKDNLVPLQGTQSWMKDVDDARLLAFQDAGHVPFLSHPGEVEQALRGFASYPPLQWPAFAVARNPLRLGRSLSIVQGNAG